MCPFKERLINTFKPLLEIVLLGWVNLPGSLYRGELASGALMFTGGKSLG